MSDDVYIVYSPDNDAILIQKCTAERLGLKKWQRSLNQEVYLRVLYETVIDASAINKFNLAMSNFMPEDQK